ncbi:hypothetical protein ACOSQ3_019423 [Xanthoceras sorbifolium]
MVKISQPDTIEEVALSVILLFILLNKKLRGVLQVVLSPLNFFLQVANFPLVRSYRLVHLPFHTFSEDLTPLGPLPLCVLKLLMKLLLFSLEHVLMCETRSLKKKKKVRGA